VGSEGLDRARDERWTATRAAHVASQPFELLPLLGFYANRSLPRRLHGVQSWTALPLEHEETEPSFVHYPAASLPALDVNGCRVRLIVGAAYGRASPVAALSPTLYFEALLPRAATLSLPLEHNERAAYVVSGSVAIAGRTYAEGSLAVAARRRCSDRSARGRARVKVIGGESVGARHIWWNLVSSSQERIERAKRDWVAGRIGKVLHDDEFIPLPDA
jgi:redox-sensitive bicupin YhaK (pirin superfamily)